MDRNPKRKWEKCPSRPQRGLVNRGSVLEGNLDPPRENVEELLELLSSLSGDLPSSSLTYPVIEGGRRNARRSGSILRQSNLSSQVELTPPNSSCAHPAWEGKSNGPAHSETVSATPRTVRFADLERYPDTPRHRGNPTEGDTLHALVDSENPGGGGYWQVKTEYPSPASAARLRSRKAPEMSRRDLRRDPEFDGPLSEPPGKQPAYFSRDLTDSRRLDYAGDLSEDEGESLSDLHGLLESSWTSASLHRSMLDLETSERLLLSELGDLSPKAAGDFSLVEMLEFAAEDGSNMYASHDASALRAFSLSQQRETSCHTGGMDSRAGKPVISEGNRVTNPLHHSNTVINSRLSSQLVRPPSARTLNSSRVPVALSQDYSGSSLKHLTSGPEDATSEGRAASERHLDELCRARRALFQHGFSREETRAEGRFSVESAELSRASFVQERSRFDREESCSYSHSTGTISASPSSAAYHMTESTEVTRFLSGETRLTTKGDLIKDTREVAKGEVRHGRSSTCPQACGDGHPPLVEKSVGKQNERTRVPDALHGPSHKDQRGVAQLSSAAYAFKEISFRDSDGNPEDKRKEVVEGGRGSTADHHFWRPLPDAAEVGSPSSVVTAEERSFLARSRKRLLSRCLQTWGHRLRRQSAARYQHGRRVLTRGLSALKRAVAMRRIQTDALATRRRAGLLSRCFGHWKACLEQKRLSALSARRDSDSNVEALRRRLIQPSDGLVLRMAYCAWRRHFQGLELFRAARIHYHLTLLFKYWLEWRRRNMIRESRGQLERRAQLHHGAGLKRRALIAWRSGWDKACRAQAHHRALRLVTAWRRWAELARGRRERRERRRRGEGLQQRAVLVPCLGRWRVGAERRRGDRDRRNAIARVAVLRWKGTVRRRRLARLCSEAEQLLAKRTLSAAFGKWCQAKSSAALEWRLAQRGRHLLARGRLQAAFAGWRRGARTRGAARALLDRARKALLSRCLQGWRQAALRRSAWLHSLSVLRTLSLSRCLQRWRHELELRRLGAAVVARARLRRQQRPPGGRAELRWGVELRVQSEPIASPQWRAHSSLDLILHHAFHTWKDSTRNLQQARVHHVSKELEKVRAALQQWHRLAQQALDAQVHSFCTQLALLDSAPSLGPDSTPPVCLFLGASVRSAQALTARERCSDRGEPSHSAVHSVYHGGELGFRIPPSSWQTERERPPLASSSPGAHTAGARADLADRPLPPGTFRPLDQSTPTHNGSPRLKAVVVSALGRIRRGPVAVAFWQWRALVRMRRGQRALLRSVGEARSRAALSGAFRTWTTGTQKRAAAHRLWERSLLSRCLTRWSGAARLRRGKAVLQREAGLFHTRGLLVRHFSTWRRRGRERLSFWEPRDSARLEGRVEWLLRRAEKRRLRRALALWAARVRQNLAVCLHRRRAVLARVFVAWEMWARRDQERRLMVHQRMRCRLCRLALDRWRILLWQRQEVRRRRANRLALQAKEILQRWHSYAQSSGSLCRLQHELAERRRTTMKRRALLSWSEGAGRLRRADASAQKSLKIRCLQQWHRRARCLARVGRAVKALEAERARGALRSAFSLWRERWRRAEQRLLGKVRLEALEREKARRELRSKFSLWRERWQRAEQRLLGRVRAVARHWRRRALRSRAEAHHGARLAGRALLHWRRALARRRERRRRVHGVAQEWLQRARLSLSHQQEALNFQRRSHGSGPGESFRRWVVAYRWSRASTSFQAQLQSRRVLLAWRGLTMVTLTRKGAVTRFQARSQERLTASHFSLWRSALERAQRRLLVLEQSLGRGRQRATLAVLQLWTAVTRGRVMLRNRNKSQLQKLFGCWKEKAAARTAADALRAESGRRVARNALSAWLRWAKESKARRRMGEAVWLWVQGRRVSGTFYQWVRVSRQNNEASQLSCTKLLHRCLCEWRLAVETRRQMSHAAVERVRNLHLYVSFSTWRRRALSQHALRVYTQQAKARREGRLLSALLRAWHLLVLAQKYRSLYLSKKYLSVWSQKMFLARSRKQREVEQRELEYRLSLKYLRRWRQWVLERRIANRRTQLLWTSWRNQAADAVFFRRMAARRLQERTWLTWRKRRIRTGVSLTFQAQRSGALLAQAFCLWRDRVL